MGRSKAFNRAARVVLDLEGGHHHDPQDRGGETCFGISKRAHPDVDIASLSRDQALEIYWRDYWFPARCDALPPPLALLLFDSAVQHGVSQGVRMLQYSLGVVADGINGPKTQDAAHKADVDHVLVVTLARRARFYVDLTHADSSQARFLGGWLRRLFRLHSAILRRCP